MTEFTLMSLFGLFFKDLRVTAEPNSSEPKHKSCNPKQTSGQLTEAAGESQHHLLAGARAFHTACSAFDRSILLLEHPEGLCESGTSCSELRGVELGCCCVGYLSAQQYSLSFACGPLGSVTTFCFCSGVPTPSLVSLPPCLGNVRV